MKKILIATILFCCVMGKATAAYDCNRVNQPKGENTIATSENIEEFEVDGIFYRVIPASNPACEVIRYKNGCKKAGNGMRYDINLQYKGDIVIPESVVFEGKEYSVTAICNVAFNHCDSLKSVYIPASITDIGRKKRSCNIFEYCPLLESIVVAPGNTVYDSRGGCNALIETATNSIVAGCKNTIIPNDVVKIGTGAFEGCSQLKEIKIPQSVNYIGEYAFANCPSLGSIVVEDGNPVYDSRERCNAIVKSASNTIIAGCNNSVVPTGIERIGAHAFRGSSLKEIALPASVTKIDNGAFMDCALLTDIEVTAEEFELGSMAFNGSGWYNSQPDGFIYFKDWLIGYKGEKKAETALDIKEGTRCMNFCILWNCSEKISSVNIPASFTGSIFGCFFNAPPIESITVAAGNPVYDSREECNAVIETATNTLYVACKNSKIPSGVKNLHNGAFRLIKGLNSVYIPASVENISSGAFNGCHDLENIVIDENNPIYDSRKGCNAVIETATNSLIAACKRTIIPDGVVNIDNAFSSCKELEEITIPKGVERIRSFAFSDCKNLKKVVLPSTLRKIDAAAFEGCTSLEIIICTAPVAPMIEKKSFRRVPSSAKLLYKSGDYSSWNTLFPGEVKKIEE